MAGQGRLGRHLGGLTVTDLTNHDDIGVLTHQGTHPSSKGDINGTLHLHLVNTRHHQLDRVLDGTEVVLGAGQLAHTGVEGGGLTRAGRTGHQHDAVGLVQQLVPDLALTLGETELLTALHQHLGVEDPHHQLLTEHHRHGREAQLDLIPIGVAGLDAAILGAALLRDIHTSQDLDATGDRRHDGRGDIVDLMQHPIDAKTHDTLVASRLHVDITGTLFEGVLKQPVDDIDYMAIIGIELAALAQLSELLQVLHTACLSRAIKTAAGTLDRTRQCVEL